MLIFSFPALFVSGTADPMNDTTLFHPIIGKQKQKDKYPPKYHWIEGGDHSFKVKGGKAANEKTIALVLKTCVNWCHSIFGTAAAEPEPDAEEDEVPPETTKKRKRGADAGPPPSKKSKTIESFFAKK